MGLEEEREAAFGRLTRMGGDRRGSRVGTVEERELGNEDLRAEDNSRGIGYFDRDAGEIRDHSGPDA
jgi:hypothetical protein